MDAPSAGTANSAATANSAGTLNQENLKRTITTPQALGISFHQIVGGGVVSLTGVAIATASMSPATGRALIIAARSQFWPTVS